MATLKINMVTTQDYHSQTPMVSCMKLRPNTFVKILVKIKCLVSVIIQLSQNIMMSWKTGAW